ncbi:hypothetical protein PR001_g16428 [Phytophthora rubi]|uniref:Myb/SANT-like domain-containing protein n=2 Tax=Phytophthora rubi TaxID=129364 RepID=A0A6A3KQY0_9STRA|nr:hypothetical protein PR001_g16428 [Phytophthora rubi]
MAENDWLCTFGIELVHRNLKLSSLDNKRMEQQMKKQGATWKRADEKLLLKCYLAARNDACLKTDKGIKSKGWAKIAARLEKEGISAEKG